MNPTTQANASNARAAVIPDSPNEVDHTQPAKPTRSDVQAISRPLTEDLSQAKYQVPPASQHDRQSFTVAMLRPANHPVLPTFLSDKPVSPEAPHSQHCNLQIQQVQGLEAKVHAAGLTPAPITDARAPIEPRSLHLADFNINIDVPQPGSQDPYAWGFADMTRDIQHTRTSHLTVLQAGKVTNLIQQHPQPLHLTICCLKVRQKHKLHHIVRHSAPELV